MLSGLVLLLLQRLLVGVVEFGYLFIVVSIVVFVVAMEGFASLDDPSHGVPTDWAFGAADWWVCGIMRERVCIFGL